MKKLKKILGTFTVFIIVLLLSSTVRASEYAYSIGANFDSACGMSGDFTQNVKYAASSYGRRADITSSFYSTEPTYSYMRGLNSNGYRRIGSRIVFINGHANPNEIVAVAHNNSTYKTGICTGSDTTAGGYTFAGLQSTNMSQVWLITFAGCTTAGNPGTTDSLIDVAYNRGASYTVGFEGEIYSRSNQGPEWLQVYNGALGGGQSVSSALTKACTAYPNCSMTYYMRNRGVAERTSQVLTNNASHINLQSTNDNSPKTLTEKIALEPIDNNYQVISTKHIEIDKNMTRIDKQPLTNYAKQFSAIINEIKIFDTTFDTDNYKVTYRIYNPDSNLGYILFTYYIDSDIETNKVYMAQIENEKITSITLAGVLKENIEKTTANEESLKDKKINFISSKQEKIASEQKNNANLAKLSIKLDSTQQMKTSTMAKNVENSNEKYYYDYNTEELKYILEVVMKDIYGTYDGETLEITL